MAQILNLLIPFFALIALGYAVGRLRLVPPEGVGGLRFLAFYLALPALVFDLVAHLPLATFAGWPFVATTTFATYCAFAIAFSIAALLNGGRVPEATIEGLTGARSNILWLAPALVIGALGTAAAAPMAIVFSFDTAMLAVATPLMMALGGTARADFGQIALRIVRDIVFQPLIVATVLGVLVSVSGTVIPLGLDTLLLMLRQAAPPLALFTFGLALALTPFGKVHVEMPGLVAVKLLVHPAIVYLLLSWVGGFDPLWMHAAILMAALPPALEVARQAEAAYAERAATTVTLATIVAIATVTIAVILVVTGALPDDPFR